MCTCMCMYTSTYTCTYTVITCLYIYTLDLWLKLDGKEMKKPYHCIWPPFTDSRPHIDWTSMTTYEVTYPHVRLYELSMEDSLSTFLSFIEALSSIPATMAIILINTEESYDLDEKFNSHRGDTPVPIVVVKRKVGLGLLQQLERYPRKVMARIQGEESSKLEIPKAGDSPEIKDDRGETYHVHIYVYMYMYRTKSRTTPP